MFRYTSFAQRVLASLLPHAICGVMNSFVLSLICARGLSAAIGSDSAGVLFDELKFFLFFSPHGAQAWRGDDRRRAGKRECGKTE